VKRQPKKERIRPSEILRRLTLLRDRTDAGLAQIEAERAEERKKMEILRAAELAAPRKRRIYFHLARLLRAGVGLEIVAGWLRTPEILEKTAQALRAAESDVDRGGLRVIKSYLAAAKKHYLTALERQKQNGEEPNSGAALREAHKKLKLEDVAREYRKLYPRHRVPALRSLGRTLQRKELWRGKPGRPPEDKNVARLVAQSLDDAM